MKTRITIDWRDWKAWGPNVAPDENVIQKLNKLLRPHGVTLADLTPEMADEIIIEAESGKPPQYLQSAMEAASDPHITKIKLLPPEHLFSDDMLEAVAEALSGKVHYDHDEVRCEGMEEYDIENKCPGTPRTCCVCEGHDCEEARAERLKHPKADPKKETTA